MSSPPKPSVTPMIGLTPIQPKPISLPTLPVAPPPSGGSPGTAPTSGSTPSTGTTAPASGSTPSTGTAAPTSGSTPSSGTTAPTSGSAGPVISLTTQNPSYQSQAAQVTVAWDPSFANLQSLTFGLTVTDNLGSTSTQKTVTVTIQQAPVATVTTPNSVVAAGSNIPLDGSQSTGVDLNYKWQLTNTTPIPSSGTST